MVPAGIFSLGSKVLETVMGRLVACCVAGAAMPGRFTVAPGNGPGGLKLGGATAAAGEGMRVGTVRAGGAAIVTGALVGTALVRGGTAVMRTLPLVAGWAAGKTTAGVARAAGTLVLTATGS